MRRIVLLMASSLMLAIAGQSLAFAADETASLKTNTVPLGGKMYKEVRVPVQSTLEVEIHTPDTSKTVTPLKRTVMKFPTDLTYNPNNKVTPVCPDSVLNEDSNLGRGIAATVDLCPRSVVGTGTSAIYLAKLHLVPAYLTDPKMVIFNGGRDSKGNARIKIYAFSKSTGTGILMQGSLTPAGVQDVAVPILTSDSAVSSFTFNIPGQGISVEDDAAPGGVRVVKGLDPEYARAKCSTGRWKTSAALTLGERDVATGQDASLPFTVHAKPFIQNCSGLAGRPRLAKLTVSGPKIVVQGRTVNYKATIRNSGTATARGVRVSVSGGGRGTSSRFNLPPETTRSIRVPTRITGSKGSRTKLLVRAATGGVESKASAPVRIRP